MTAATYPNRAREHAGLTLRNEAAEVMCCLRESLSERAFIEALLRLVFGDGQDKQWKIAERVGSGAFAENTGPNFPEER